MVWVPKKSTSGDKDAREAKKRLAHSMGERKDVSANTSVIKSAPNATEPKGTKFIGSVILFMATKKFWLMIGLVS